MNKEVDAFKPDLLMLSTTNTSIYEDIKIMNDLKARCGAVTVLKGAIFYAPEQEMLDLLDICEEHYLLGNGCGVHTVCMCCIRSR